MKLLIQHNQEIAQLSPDPFPLLRAGSGDETTAVRARRNPRRRRTYIRIIGNLSVQCIMQC